MAVAFILAARTEENDRLRTAFPRPIFDRGLDLNSRTPIETAIGPSQASHRQVNSALAS